MNRGRASTKYRHAIVKEFSEVLSVIHKTRDSCKILSEELDQQWNLRQFKIGNEMKTRRVDETLNKSIFVLSNKRFR